MPASPGPGKLQSTEAPLHEIHDLLMLDLDGVVYRGREAVPGAAETLGEVVQSGGELAYLTNNASRTATEVAAHLRELGMPVRSHDDVVTSAQAVARLMAEQLPAGAPVLVIGGEGLRAPLVELGLRPVSSLDDEPAAVVQGFHPEIGWGHLAEAAYAVATGMPWYASNIDSSIPTDRGTAPGNGTLVQAVATATGRTPTVAGKPARPLFEETLRRTGAATPLMVGDRVDTDIDGATAMDLPSLAVLTGVSDLDELAALEPGRRPAYVASSVAGLLEPHPAVEISADRAVCDGVEAHTEGDEIRLRQVGPEQEVGTAGLRAMLALAWRVHDSGASVPRLGVPGRRGRRSVP